MSEIIVYTKSFIMRKAITELMGNRHDVFFFKNQLQFLTCATVLHNSIILIDTVESPVIDVRWLYTKLESRGLSRRIHYIVPSILTANSYLSGFLMFSNTVDLKRLDHQTRKNRNYDLDININEIVYLRVIQLLKKSEADFLTSFYNPDTSELKPRTKNEASRLYYVRTKLSLQNTSELKQLLLLLSNTRLGLSEESNEKKSNFSKKLLNNLNIQPSF